MTMTNNQDLFSKLRELRARLETELAEEAALEEALTMPLDQLRAELIADGVDLDEDARQFKEMLMRVEEKSDSAALQKQNDRSNNILPFDSRTKAEPVEFANPSHLKENSRFTGSRRPDRLAPRVRPPTSSWADNKIGIAAGSPPKPLGSVETSQGSVKFFMFGSAVWVRFPSGVAPRSLTIDSNRYPVRLSTDSEARKLKLFAVPRLSVDGVENLVSRPESDSKKCRITWE
jgi:hypothetical protein